MAIGLLKGAHAVYKVSQAAKAAKAAKAVKAAKSAKKAKKTVKSKPKEQYEVVDRQTGSTVGKPVNSSKAASRKVDRLDNKYGGYRYTKRKVK